MSINLEKGTTIRITREMERKFRDVPELLRWMQAVSYKLNGSTETLADTEQTSLVPLIGVISELTRRVTALEKSSADRHRLNELERKVKAIESPRHNAAMIHSILRDIEDLKRSV